ncbi:MAG: HEAT repeat domain-containing protein [Gemmatimonadaceae bacterium]|nr:HEAT repeat domain-containing protein [Gemmatimonadaceae bacterium]
MRPLAPLLCLSLLLARPVTAAAQDRAPLVGGRPEADWREDLRNPQPIVRQAALEALAQFADVTESTILHLTPLIGDPDVAVRRTAIRAIGHGGRAARRASSALWRAWRDDDPLVAADAGIALVQIGEPNIRLFRERLPTGEPRDRARAAAALANAGPAARGAIHALRDQLGDDDARVRGASLAAIAALDEKPGRTTATLVARSLARDLGDSPQLDAPDAIVRARTALTILARAARDAKQTTPTLQLILWDGPAPLRAHAAQVLGRIPGDGDRALGMAMAAGDASVREAALRGFVAERSRRRALPAVLDSLRRIDPALDTARTRAMVEAIGYVAQRHRDVDRALARVLDKAPALAPQVTLARRRLTIGF